MAVTPNALFEAANVLGNSESEVDLRNAASRAYYAAYHQCRPLGQGLSLPSSPDQGGVHRKLIDTLTGASNRKLKSLGYRLEQCRKLRVMADYVIGSEFLPQDAWTALAQCSKILSEADSMLSASGAGS